MSKNKKNEKRKKIRINIFLYKDTVDKAKEISKHNNCEGKYQIFLRQILENYFAGSKKNG